MTEIIKISSCIVYSKINVYLFYYYTSLIHLKLDSVENWTPAAEMRFLRYICGHTLKNHRINETGWNISVEWMAAKSQSNFACLGTNQA